MKNKFLTILGFHLSPNDERKKYKKQFKKIIKKKKRMAKIVKGHNDLYNLILEKK